MAYTPSLREIPLDQEPHASVLAALLPDTGDGGDESPESLQVDWNSVTDEQRDHLRQCLQCLEVLGGYGQVSVGTPTLTTPPSRPAMGA